MDQEPRSCLANGSEPFGLTPYGLLGCFMRVDDIGGLTSNFSTMKNPVFHVVYVEALVPQVRAEFQSSQWTCFFENGARVFADMQCTILRYDIDGYVDRELWKAIGLKNSWTLEVSYQYRDTSFGGAFGMDDYGEVIEHGEGFHHHICRICDAATDLWKINDQGECKECSASPDEDWDGYE